jgi:hypothetical protein
MFIGVPSVTPTLTMFPLLRTMIFGARIKGVLGEGYIMTNLSDFFDNGY